MRVQISPVGEHAQRRDIEWKWPEDWPPPRLDEEIEYPTGEDNNGPNITVYVRTVVWYPNGSSDDEEGEPFVYVVVGPRRM